MKRYIFLLCSLILLQTCSYNPLIEGEGTSLGQVRMSVDMSLAPSDVTSLAGVFSREGFDSVFFDFDIVDNVAEAFVEELEQGTWQLYVKAMNSNGIVLYDGSTSVLIIANTINSINLHLDPASSTGSIKITVTWGSRGLLAKYSFSGNANDESGNGNDGRVYGATLTEDRFGNPNSAYEFDGIDDYIWLGDNNNLRPTQISISAWFKSVSSTSGPEGMQFIIRSRLWGYSISLNPYLFDYQVEHVGGIASILALNDQVERFRFISPDTNYNNGQWHFVVVTYNGTVFKAYIDGQLISEDVSDIRNNIYYESGGISIGRDGDYDSRYFDGSIDDIYIFDKALSEQEIQNLYNP